MNYDTWGKKVVRGEGTRFMAQGTRFKTQGTRFKDQGTRFKARVQDSWPRVQAMIQELSQGSDPKVLETPDH